MNFAIVFSPNAEKDLQEICEYYKNISSKINEKFLENVEIRLKKLSITPLAATIRYANIRCTRIKKFPYLIHYYLNEQNNAIVILRIFSTHQKPLWNKA